MKKYWFRPKKFWGWFAAYYPASIEGWAATLFLLLLFITIFTRIDAQSHSWSDTLLAFSPWAIALFLAFDILSFRKGEYPSWWKK